MDWVETLHKQLGCEEGHTTALHEPWEKALGPDFDADAYLEEAGEDALPLGLWTLVHRVPATDERGPWLITLPIPDPLMNDLDIDLASEIIPEIMSLHYPEKAQ